MASVSKLFYSYSHRDENLRNELDKHLSALRRSGHISEGHDRRIEHCHDIEVKRALERHSAGEVRVIPVILRPVDCKGTSFSHLPALPKDGRAITAWQNLDEALKDVAEGIRIATSTVPLALMKRTRLPEASYHISAYATDSYTSTRPISGAAGL